MTADQLLPEGRLSCLWVDEDDYWETECGRAFQFHSGSPFDNSMTFCCFCGGILREKVHESD